MQVEHVAQRDLLLKTLQLDAAKPTLTIDPIFRPGHYDEQPENQTRVEP